MANLARYVPNGMFPCAHLALVRFATVDIDCVVDEEGSAVLTVELLRALAILS